MRLGTVYSIYPSVSGTNDVADTTVIAQTEAITAKPIAKIF